jgi:hypothetical protein
VWLFPKNCKKAVPAANQAALSLFISYFKSDYIARGLLAGLGFNNFFSIFLTEIFSRPVLSFTKKFLIICNMLLRFSF